MNSDVLGFDCDSIDEARRRLAAVLDLTPDDIVIEPRTVRVFRWAAAGLAAHGRCTVVDTSHGERLRVDLDKPRPRHGRR